MGKFKAKKAKVDHFVGQTVEEQFTRDADILKAYLDKGENKTPSQKILARTFQLITAKGDVEFKSKDNPKYRSIAEENEKLQGGQPPFNYAALLGHGGRVEIELSDSEIDEVLKWLLTGDPKGPIKYMGPEKAEEANQGYHERKFASHHISNGKEIKLLPFDPRVVSTAKGRHIGVNLGLNGGEENGSNGHLYIHVHPGNPPKDKARLLIGLENSAPLKKDKDGNVHGPSSKSKKTSATNGAKFTNKFFEGYPIVPDDVGGKKVTLKSNDVAQLIDPKAKSFESDILSQPISKENLVHKKKVECTTTVINGALKRRRAYADVKGATLTLAPKNKPPVVEATTVDTNSLKKSSDHTQPKPTEAKATEPTTAKMPDSVVIGKSRQLQNDAVAPKATQTMTTKAPSSKANVSQNEQSKNTWVPAKPKMG